MKSFFKVILIALVVALIFAVSFNISCQKKVETYKVCAIFPLTGPVAPFGEEMARGVEIGKTIANEKILTKKKIEITLEDGKAEPKESITAFNKSRMGNYKIFITTLSSISLALIPVAVKDSILLFADASHPKISDSGKTIFRHSNTAPQEASLIATYIKEEFRLEKICILVVNDDYGISFRDEVIKKINELSHVSKIVGKFEYEKNMTNYKAIAIKAINSKPKIIIIAGVGKSLGLLIKELRIYGYKDPIITTLGLTLPDARTAAGDALSNCFHSTFDFDRSDTFFTEMSDIYFQRYNKAPSDFAILECNTILLIGESLEKCKTNNPQIISDFIRSLTHYKGVGETMMIQTNGDILPKLKMEQAIK